MASLVTTAGAAHIVSLDAGTTPTNAFDALELGQGNDTPAVSDTRATVTEIVSGSLVQLEAGYPIKGDTDPRNPGRASTAWSWLFVIPAADSPVVASNWWITNYQAGSPGASEPIGVHGDETIYTERRRRTLVWVNVDAGTTVSVYTLAVEDPRYGADTALHAAREDVLWAGGGTTQLGVRRLARRSRVGQSIPLRGRVYDSAGNLIGPADVTRVVRSVRILSADGEWCAVSRSVLTPDAVLSFATSPSGPEFPQRGGFNLSTTWAPGKSQKAGRYEVVYGLDLVDGDRREIVIELDVSTARGL